MVVAVVLGTRPEIIKLAPVVRELGAKKVPFEVVHTGQHYSDEMDAVFFRDLHLPLPTENLHAGSASGASQTGEMMVRLDAYAAKRELTCVIVLGDTNSVLAGALVAAKRHIPCLHLEAGLRSGDRWMPEEVNRIVTDHIADWLIAPTEGARANLGKEGLPAARIVVTGNTIVDAVREHRPFARNRPASIPDLTPGRYVLATVHRAENLEFPERFRGILEGLRRLGQETSLPVVYPMHPHSQRRAKEQGQDLSGIRIVNPVGYLDFLRLQMDAAIVVTDSGGVQEEACVLGVPCVTVRDNTERPETLDVGANVLAGAAPDRIVAAAKAALAAKRTWTNPFGDGFAAKRIVELVRREGLAGASAEVLAPDKT